MTPSIPPDLQQNLAIAAELTLFHNVWAILYFLGLIVAIVWSLVKPSRSATLAFLGFALLLFSFEYTKHILEPFRNQTMSQIITEQPHLKVQRLIDISLIRIIPSGSFITGWISLLLSFLLYTSPHFLQKKGKKKRLT